MDYGGPLMKIIRNTLPIADIYKLITSGELIINRNYQRSSGLWPNNARAYFIDTILNEFPFPKVILRQSIDLKTKSSIREIIDGQQRITTICDFIDNKFKLTSVSEQFSGSYFSDLTDDERSVFLSYEISLDNIISASDDEILEIFRRINSYTLPLNPPEKRHATYQGIFKWFVSKQTEMFNPFFEKYNILTIRRISRLEDADLLTEIIQGIIFGIIARSDSKLDAIYKNNDDSFDLSNSVDQILFETFNFIKSNLRPVFENCTIQPYQFYSLVLSLVFNRYGFINVEYSDSLKVDSTALSASLINQLIDLKPKNCFVDDINYANEKLIELFSLANEKNLENSKYYDFVVSSISTTHSLKNRLFRFIYITNILQKNI